MTDTKQNEASNKLISEPVEGVKEKKVTVEKKGNTWEYVYKAMHLPQYNKTFIVLERNNLNFRNSSKKPVWIPVEDFEMHIEGMKEIYDQLETAEEEVVEE